MRSAGSEVVGGVKDFFGDQESIHWQSEKCFFFWREKGANRKKRYLIEDNST